MAVEDDDLARWYLQFGKHLRLARAAANLSQEQLGTEVGLNRTSISNIEKGRQRLLVHQLPVLAHVLRTTVDELLPAAASPDPLSGLSQADRDAILEVRRGAAR